MECEVQTSETELYLIMQNCQINMRQRVILNAEYVKCCERLSSGITIWSASWQLSTG